ncbi:hypothetical protein SAMN06265171_101992 [Chryseobacterium rhizoplanae]|uniref:Uncharacterized protein n=1 Tax=Chryseobacterium rhizoplanae TaxID=1609531 RepID=A0A521BHL8_9FLAO|nr:hypothetical protein SAMN06265171_101992 [Chryseobacterium rhizoplanae]
MSDGDGFNNNLVEYNMLHVGLIAKAQSFIIDCVGFKDARIFRLRSI